MRKEVMVCDICGKQIADEELAYSVRPEDISGYWDEVDICQECLLKGLIYDGQTNRFKIANDNDNVTRELPTPTIMSQAFQEKGWIINECTNSL